MNVPAVAKRSFEELRNHPDYTSIINYIVSALKKINSSLDRARYVHQAVDSYNDEVFSHPLVKQLSPCKKGCNACCHTQVSVTQDEAELLVLRIQEGVAVDLERLKIQTEPKNDGNDYYKIPYQDRRCIFLGADGACTVYEDRPSVCRTNAVLSEASLCDTSNGIKPIRLIKTSKSDMVIYASYLATSDSGTLPFMISKILVKA
jgi:uncharacterized protein